MLVDGTSKNNKGVFCGRTDGFKLVNFRGDKSLVGTIQKVKVTDAKTFSLFGEIVPDGKGER